MQYADPCIARARDRSIGANAGRCGDAGRYSISGQRGCDHLFDKERYFICYEDTIYTLLLAMIADELRSGSFRHMIAQLDRMPAAAAVAWWFIQH
ncbi:hypothetical protein SAMN04487769_3285 [Burkholderia sp. b14]|nr:hypothetical protein SAMN04487769_3285 [Burkholderia sp. b14]